MKRMNALVLSLLFVISAFLNDANSVRRKSAKVLYHSVLQRAAGNAGTATAGSLLTPNIPQSAGETIVILHGLLGSSRNFQSWSRLLHRNLGGCHDIVCMDLRNHGRSAMHGAQSITYDEMAEDVLKTLKFLNLHKGGVHLVGHSMGGKVAAAVALKTTTTRSTDTTSVEGGDQSSMRYNSGSDSNDRSNTSGTFKGSVPRILSVSMMDISPIAYTADELSDVVSTVQALHGIKSTVFTQNSVTREMVVEEIKDKFTDPSLRMFVQSNLVSVSAFDSGNAQNRIQNRIPSRASKPDLANAEREQQQQQLQFEWSFLIDQVAQDISNIISFELPAPQSSVPAENDQQVQFPGPALILKAGKASNFVRSTHLPQIARIFPKYTFASLREAGHWLHAEKPEESAEIVSRFIQSVRQYYQQMSA